MAAERWARDIGGRPQGNLGREQGVVPRPRRSGYGEDRGLTTKEWWQMFGEDPDSVPGYGARAMFRNQANLQREADDNFMGGRFQFDPTRYKR